MVLQIAAPTFEVRAALVPSTFNPEALTVEAVLSQGARVMRAPWWDDEFLEELEMSEDALRLDRLNTAGSLTVDHRTRNIRDGAHVGTVVQGSARLAPSDSPQGFELRATLQLSRRDDDFMRGLRQDVGDGIIRSISIEYRVHAFRDVTTPDDKLQVLRAIDWEPFGASLVSQPADLAGSVREADDGTLCTIYTDREMTKPKGKTAGTNGAGTPAPGTASSTPPVDPAGQRATNPTPAPDPAPAARAADPAPAPAPAPAAAPAPAFTQADLDAAAQRAVAGDRERSSTIRSLCSTARLPDDFADELVRDANITVDTARARIFDRMAADQAAGTGAVPITSGIAVTREESSKRTEGMSEALLQRQGLLPEGQALSDGGRLYVGSSLRELARNCLELRGERPQGWNVEQVIERALAVSYRGDLSLRDDAMHSTSDFGSMLGDVANKAMRMRYDLSPRTFLPWARRRDFNDYKVNKAVQLSEWPSLTQIGEGGEIDVITFGDTQETWVGRRYGNRFALTIEAIVNDDLGGFDRLATSAGEAAAQIQSDIVYALLTDNVTLADGNPVFDAAHSNVGTQGMDLDALTEMQTAMMTQLGLAGQHLNLMPRHLRVPVAILTATQQLVTSITPDTPASVNPFANRFATVEAEPRLDLASATAWYAFADPGQIDTVQFGFLAGTDGPRIEQRLGFAIDGVEWKITLPFGAGFAEHRGVYRSTGVA